jgi:hypothetical protein
VSPTTYDGADGESRTRTTLAGPRILSPVCLPVPPRPHLVTGAYSARPRSCRSECSTSIQSSGNRSEQSESDPVEATLYLGVSKQANADVLKPFRCSMPAGESKETADHGQETQTCSSPRMDYKGREGTQEALEEQNSRYNDFSNAKAHARRSQTKGPAVRNLDRSSKMKLKGSSSLGQERLGSTI